MINSKTAINFLFTVILFTQISINAQQKSLAQSRLVVNSFSPQSDSILSIGVLIDLNEGWHIYWRNPGDSGLPTDIEFTLPTGIKISNIEFPVPKVFSSDEIVNYGYSHQVLLMSDLQIAKDFPQNEIFISAKLKSLICKDYCKAFDTTLTITLDLSQNYFAKKDISDLFNKTKNLLPLKKHNFMVTATNKSDSVYLRIDKTASFREDLKYFEFYPYQLGVFKNISNKVSIPKNKGLELVLEPAPYRINSPDNLIGIIIFNKNSAEAIEINIPITY